MRSAIMDIGYNAIRAVVYENDSIGASEIFNSKFKSDILNLLTHDSINIKHQTYLSIQYLLHVFQKLEVSNIKCVATAVLRNHPRADDFIKHIKDEYNFDIEVISGEKEAELTALGLTTVIKDCNGIAADLGGGSLEIIEIEHGNVKRLSSFELGTKIIRSSNSITEDEITNILTENYDTHTCDNLYLIGGTLRFIGKLYLDIMQYPIKNLHNLEINTDDFSAYLKKLRSSSQNIKGKPGHRHISHNAIFIAETMIKIFEPKKIIISTYGLKEGVRFLNLSKSERQKDIILEKIQQTCNFDLQKTDFQSYYDIINPLLLDQQTNYDRTIKAVIMLLSLQHKFDRNLHPVAISEFILSSEIPFTQRMRIMLALILSYATSYKPETELIKTAKKLISKEELNICQIVGHILYIAEIVDGPIFTSPSFKITINNQYLEIVSNDILPRSIFEKICYRLKSIAFARKMNSN